jgi:hypothetical protein
MAWPRTASGTLQCPCGKPGTIFTIIGVYEKDGKQYGDFVGYCCESHKEDHDIIYGDGSQQELGILKTAEQGLAQPRFF